MNWLWSTWTWSCFLAIFNKLFGPMYSYLFLNHSCIACCPHIARPLPGMCAHNTLIHTHTHTHTLPLHSHFSFTYFLSFILLFLSLFNFWLFYFIATSCHMQRMCQGVVSWCGGHLAIFFNLKHLIISDEDWII